MVTMGRLDAEAKTTMSFLMRKGQSKSEVARLLGVTEDTVRYHAKRKAAGAVDGRLNQKSKAKPFAGPIADWHGQHAAECLSIRINRKLKSTDVIDVLSDLFILRGVPEHIR